jgi:hypothetical protein
MIPFGALAAIWTSMNLRRRREEDEEEARREEEACKQRREAYKAEHDDDDTLKPWNTESGPELDFEPMSPLKVHIILFVLGCLIGRCLFKLIQL